MSAKLYQNLFATVNGKIEKYFFAEIKTAGGPKAARHEPTHQLTTHPLTNSQLTNSPTYNSPTHPLYTVNVHASLLLSPLGVITERNPFSPATVPA